MQQYSLIRFTSDTVNRDGFGMSQLSSHLDNQLVFLGEIPNMPHHCVVLDSTLNTHIVGIHISNFEEIPLDET